MLKIFVILALCIVAIKASGHMYVIDSPTSLEFNGNEKLNSDYVGDVVSACLGNWVDDALKWSGLYIINPFSTAKSAVVLIFTGIPEIHIKFQLKSYMLTGSSSQESMNALRSEVESHIVVDFEQLSLATNKIIEEFGEIQAKIDTLKTKFLKPELHSSDKEFLTTMALLNEMTDKIMASPEPPTLVTCHVPLESIAKTHGEKSPAMDEAMQFVADIMYKLHQSAKKDKLIIAVTEKSEPNRAKRETGDAASAKSLNLAAYYNEDYPVIFNIILWFMVVLGFSLLAICYAIGSMDPGRDSIIYRMTSTRMKKDN